MNVGNDMQSQLLFAANDATAVQSAILDVKGRGSYATICIHLGAELNTNAEGPDISLAEADDTNATSFATITADRADEDITAAKLVRYDIDLRGRKRYLKLTVTPSTSTNDVVPISASAHLSALGDGPTSDAERTLGTTDVAVSVTP